MSQIVDINYAISDTGPLISAFQSESYALLTQLFSSIRIPTACFSELKKHGWEDEVKAASIHLLIVELTPNEEERAKIFAQEIAKHPDSNDSVSSNHIGEAEAIVLALKPEHRNNLILLDELAARAIAKQAGLNLSGFPGALLLAVRIGLISPDKLKSRLELCRKKGTHYSTKFIQEVYLMAKQDRR